jgi:hypothetical protein
MLRGLPPSVAPRAMATNAVNRETREARVTPIPRVSGTQSSIAVLGYAMVTVRSASASMK